MKCIAWFAMLSAAMLAASIDTSKPIPFDLHKKGVIFVQASIAGSAPLDFVLDSGTVRTTLDESVATRLGLDLSMKAQSSGANGMEHISVVKDQTLKFGGVEVAEPLVMVYPLDALSNRLGRRVDGIIGVQLFSKRVVEIDYPNHQLRISAPEAFTYSGRGEAVPVTYDRDLPVVAALVKPYGKDPIATHFQLDTGAAGAVVVFWKEFVQQHDLQPGVRDLTSTEATGFGGDHAAWNGRVESIQVGGITLKEPAVRLSDLRFGEPDVFGGNLGSGFYEPLRVTFDLPHDRVFFDKAALTTENTPLLSVPFEYYRGLVFIDVLVNGKVARLALDSAAGHPALDLNQATSLGLDVSVEALSSGPNADSAQPVRAAMNVTYAIGKAQVTEPATAVYSFEFLAHAIDHPFAGVLGGRLFRQYVVALDYPQRQLRLYDAASFQPPAQAKVIPLEVTESDLTVRASIISAAGQKEVEGLFSLDTGATEADVVLWKPCTASGALAAAAKDLKASHSTSFGGTRPAQSGHLAQLRLGDLVIENPNVRFTDVYASGEPSSRHCGNIGSALFERFNVIFDAPHARLVLQERATAAGDLQVQPEQISAFSSPSRK